MSGKADINRCIPLIITVLTNTRSRNQRLQIKIPLCFQFQFIDQQIQEQVNKLEMMSALLQDPSKVNSYFISHFGNLSSWVEFCLHCRGVTERVCFPLSLNTEFIVRLCRTFVLKT